MFFKTICGWLEIPREVIGIARGYMMGFLSIIRLLNPKLIQERGGKETLAMGYKVGVMEVIHI